MGEQIRIEGLDRLLRTLGGAARDIADLRTANITAMRLLTTRGRSSAPRGATGGLAMAVRGDVAKQGAKNYAVVEDPKVYAKRVHWGFRAYAQAPQPWLLRTGRQYRRQVLKAYRDQTVKTVRKVRGA